MKHIDEAIYDLGQDKVIRKKKSVIAAVVVLAVGIAMVVASMAPGVRSSENMYTALVFLGWTLIVAGVVWALVVLFSKGARAYYVPTKEFLKRTEMYYDGDKFSQVAGCVNSGDFEKLASIEGGEGASVMVVLYQGRKGGVTMCQLLRYIPHNYEPECEMLIFEK